ncbi:hypothetical protein [Pseudactinotalea sp.]|uniref:hypothetical protein n=1 Tax=Pseudactinotalea sp. TaxID=1926260 RepID=UPI003B3B1CB0
MHTARKAGLLTLAGAASVATVLAPLPAMADDAPATGTVTVTRFDDRYADGLFDPSKIAPSGDRDVKRDGTAWLLTSEGEWLWAGTNDEGDYVFENVPVGEAQVHLSAPNSPTMEAFFDATDATSAADVVRLPISNARGTDSGVATIQVEADGTELLVGMTALRTVAQVQLADGTPVDGLTTVELGSAGDWYPATEYSFEPGTYEAFQSEGYGYIRHLPGLLGVRVTPPAGYQVASVTAADNNELPVTQVGDAYYFDSAGVWQYFWNPRFTVTLEEVPDTTRPELALISPTTVGPFQALSLQVDATDEAGLQRIVANIYSGSTLVTSTQTRLDGALAGTHTATVNLPDGAYTIRYNAQDLAGNISRTSTFDVVVDGTAPTVTVKEGPSFTVGTEVAYDKVSFKLYDAHKIDRAVLNGFVIDLSNNTWSDVNFIRPGVFGGVTGENTLVVYDVAGNARTITFTLS